MPIVWIFFALLCCEKVTSSNHQWILFFFFAKFRLYNRYKLTASFTTKHMRFETTSWMHNRHYQTRLLDRCYLCNMNYAKSWKGEVRKGQKRWINHNLHHHDSIICSCCVLYTKNIVSLSSTSKFDDCKQQIIKKHIIYILIRLEPYTKRTNIVLLMQTFYQEKIIGISDLSVFVLSRSRISNLHGGGIQPWTSTPKLRDECLVPKYWILKKTKKEVRTCDHKNSQHI